ncbi:unnamed protein product [Prorocentrum cordatum]|uniref:Fe2OG dioxygenase domain-containing protein n=1 Tax=Prorocentrum cordatum TaxID=2364126 RepID=A0ABN9QQ62_9DINO|nr:unnamed protein product [Polarella glacialis]
MGRAEPSWSRLGSSYVGSRQIIPNTFRTHPDVLFMMFSLLSKWTPSKTYGLLCGSVVATFGCDWHHGSRKFHGHECSEHPESKKSTASLELSRPFREVKFGDSSSLFFRNSVILVPDLFSKEECESLRDAAEVGVQKGAGLLRPGASREDPWKAIRRYAAKRGLGYVSRPELLERIPIRNLDAEVQDLSAALLRNRVLPFIERELPEIAETLFGSRSGLQNMDFCFSPDEPAINRYVENGEFRVHTDDRSFTVYVLLSEPGAFAGGGTAFWAQDLKPHEVGDRAADIVLQPGQGVGVIFNGRVSHAGGVVTSGIRHLYVASFDLQPTM